jgi:hypothetical protein
MPSQSIPLNSHGSVCMMKRWRTLPSVLRPSFLVGGGSGVGGSGGARATSTELENNILFPREIPFALTCRSQGLCFPAFGGCRASARAHGVHTACTRCGPIFFGASHPRVHPMILANTLPSHSSTSFSQPEPWIIHLVLPNFVGVSLTADEVDLCSRPIDFRVRHLAQGLLLICINPSLSILSARPTTTPQVPRLISNIRHPSWCSVFSISTSYEIRLTFVRMHR